MKWVKQFNEGKNSVHDEALRSWPSVVNDDLKSRVDETIQKNKPFTMPEFSRFFALNRLRLSRLSQVLFAIGSKNAY